MAERGAAVTSRLSAEIERGVALLGQALPPGVSTKLAKLLVLLERWNVRINLTSVSGLDAMVSAHVLDSLAARPHLAGTTVIDIGTGAGFPGLPLALAEPGRRIELLDSGGKKIAFVRHIIGDLGIANATAVKARAEHYAPGMRFDTVVARGFAGIPKLVELAGHLVGDRGVLLAQKGKYPHDELRQFMDRPDLSDLWDYDVTELTVPGLETHARHIVSLRRRRPSGRGVAAT